MGVVEGWVRDFYSVCHLVKRLDRPDGDFLADVLEREEVRFASTATDGRQLRAPTPPSRSMI